MDEPAYQRRGIDLTADPYRVRNEEPDRKREDDVEPERPAFLRKIMD